MPFRSLYVPAPVHLVSQSNREQCIDDSALSIPSDLIDNDALGIVVDNWDDWFKWDGMVETFPSFESRRQSLGSSLYESESSGPDLLRNTDSVIDENDPEDDAVFEPIDPNISHHITTKFQSFPMNDENRSNPASRAESIENPGRPLHAYSTLSITEERRLRDIAMPNSILERVNIVEQDIAVPIAVELKGRLQGIKRKSPATKAENFDLCQNQKQNHNIIEKRYRMNLNDKIDVLRQSIPALHDKGSPLKEDDDEGVDPGAGSVSTHKSGKAAVLTGAVAYISQLESSTKHLAEETATLKVRLEAFKKLAMSGSIFSGEDMCNYPHISEPLEDSGQTKPMKAILAVVQPLPGTRKKRIRGP